MKINLPTKLLCTFLAFISLLFLHCQSPTEKHFQLTKNLAEHVEIIDFATEETMAMPFISITDSHLIITDLGLRIGSGIYIFDKNSLEYLGNTGLIGEGPGEITRYGSVVPVPNTNEFLMPDFGKLKVFRFHFDSALSDDKYKPWEYLDFDKELFLSDMKYLDSSTLIGTCIEPLSPSTFRTSLGRWDINSGVTSKFGYEHPDLLDQRTNGAFDLSKKHGLIAFANVKHDLISIMDLEGNLNFNLFGPHQVENPKNRYKYFSKIKFAGDYLFASYLGEESFTLQGNSQPKSNHPSKILVFDLKGDLIKYFETKHQIATLEVDHDNKKVYCFFLDREIPIGFFKYE